MSLTPRAWAKARGIRFYFRDEGNVFDPKSVSAVLTATADSGL
ncbi:MAG TPA: hypothetical protein VE860_10660 [Chthoniobacterales bacterium]|nr:hypothetical protein [Chthoniobacterales bacterium]